VPTRWAKAALCTLAVSTAFLVSGGVAGGVADAAAAGAGADPPALTLDSQTAVITPASPWFRLAVGVGETSVAPGDLYVSVGFYSRITDMSQLQQATGATPDKTLLTPRVDLPVTLTPLGRVSTACVTVLPESSTSPPTPAAGTTPCPAGAPTVPLNCTPDIGRCIGVYPVSVALFRHGSSSALSRFTTFLAYQEPIGAGNGPLRVGVIMPVGPQSDRAPPTSSQLSAAESETTQLAEHDNVHVTVAVAPAAAAGLAAGKGGKARTARDELADLTDPGGPGGDQLLAEPYTPINVAALARAQLSGEISEQMARGTTLLHEAGLHPTPGAWVDTTSQFSTADSTNLASGLRSAGANRLVVDDSVLALPSGASQSPLTFAQTFALDLGHGGRVSAAATNSVADSRFSADPGNPNLAANQLLATLEFIHFENAYTGTRGVVVEPPAGWRPTSAFLSTLLSGMTNNPVVMPVTLDEFFAQVPAGGNSEPASLHLQSGPAAGVGAISRSAAQRIAVARAHLHSFTLAVAGHPSELTTLSDQLLSTESRALNGSRRSARLDSFSRSFGAVLSAISLGAEHTITFTSRTAQIPIAVESTAPYRVTVVMSLSSDKFTFPSGDTRTLTLAHATTAVRVPARARTSGDRLPVDVTLRTPDGDLTISHTVLTVHSTSISLVGVALTVVAGLVLLVWWGRTWRRGRRHGPRAH
jgi:hypothetical protein